MNKVKKGKIRTRFVAGNHLCWFSRRPDLQNLRVVDAIKIDPKYIDWCIKNLKHLRFAPRIKRRTRDQLQLLNPNL